MDWNDIEDFISTQKKMEGHRHEFKEGFGADYTDKLNKGISEAIVSFANSEGGQLIIGIKNNPIRVQGIDKAKWGDHETLSNFVKTILEKNNVSPAIFDRYVLLQPIVDKSGTVVIIYIEVEKGLKPYYDDGKIFIRGANGKIQLTDYRDIIEFISMRSEGDLIYRELIRAYRNRVTFNSSSSEGRQGGYVYGEGKHIAFIEKYEANADFPFCFVTFNDALENLSEIIKRNHYSFIERENLRDELLSLCVFWNHYRDTWFSQYRSIQHKGLALQYFHKKILEILPQAIKDFEKEFKIAPGLFDTK